MIALAAILLAAVVVQIRAESIAGNVATHLKPMCAVLNVYPRDPLKCSNGDVRQLKIACWNKPGSPCVHEAGFPDMSVKDVYCNNDGYHEPGYQGTDSCDETKGEKIPLDFPKGQCSRGMKSVSCTSGACQYEADDTGIILDTSISMLPLAEF